MKKWPISLQHRFRTTALINFVCMPKPLRFISPLLLLAFSILLFACGKEETPPTVINGKVTDKKTGTPIEGATFNVDFCYEINNNGSIVIEHVSKYLNTDQQGEIHYTHDSNWDYICYSDASKEGYIGHPYLGIKRGEENNIDIKLIPRDGVLRLNVVNTDGQYDSIWVALDNPSYTSEAQGLPYRILLSEFPLILSQGESHIENFNLTSEEFTKIYWGFSNILPMFTSAPFRDSIYLILNDTTDITISF